MLPKVMKNHRKTNTAKGGPPLGSKNNLRHGRYAISLATLPKDCAYITRLTRVMKRQIETAVVQARGETTIFDCSVIEECCEWEAHRRLCRRYMRKQSHKLT